MFLFGSGLFSLFSSFGFPSSLDVHMMLYGPGFLVSSFLLFFVSSSHLSSNDDVAVPVYVPLLTSDMCMSIFVLSDARVCVGVYVCMCMSVCVYIIRSGVFVSSFLLFFLSSSHLSSNDDVAVPIYVPVSWSVSDARMSIIILYSFSWSMSE